MGEGVRVGTLVGVGGTVFEGDGGGVFVGLDWVLIFVAVDNQVVGVKV